MSLEDTQKSLEETRTFTGSDTTPTGTSGLAQIRPAAHFDDSDNPVSKEYTHRITVRSVGTTSDGEQVYREQDIDVLFPESFYDKDGTLNWEASEQAIGEFLSKMADDANNDFAELVRGYSKAQLTEREGLVTSSGAESAQISRLLDHMGYVDKAGLIAEYDLKAGYNEIYASFDGDKDAPEIGSDGMSQDAAPAQQNDSGGDFGIGSYTPKI